MDGTEHDFEDAFNATLNKVHEKKNRLNIEKSCLENEIQQDQDVMVKKLEYIKELRDDVFKYKIIKLKIIMIYEQIEEKLPVLENLVGKILKFMHIIDCKMDILKKICQEKFVVGDNVMEHKEICESLKSKLSEHQYTVQQLLESVRKISKEINSGNVERLLKQCITTYQLAIEKNKENKSIRQKLDTLKKEYENEVVINSIDIKTLERKEIEKNMKLDELESEKLKMSDQLKNREHNATLKSENLKLKEDICKQFEEACKYSAILYVSHLTQMKKDFADELKKIHNELLFGISEMWDKIIIAKNGMLQKYKLITSEDNQELLFNNNDFHSEKLDEYKSSILDLQHEQEILKENLRQQRQNIVDINHAYNHLYKMLKKNKRKCVTLDNADNAKRVALDASIEIIEKQLEVHQINND